MKKNSLPMRLIAFALTLACVLSCDEQSEALTQKKELPLGLSGRTVSTQTADFNGLEGDPIDLATAREWTSNFRSTLKNSDEVLAHYFGFEIIQSILRQTGCVGIRIYYALDSEGNKKLLLVGVDSKGQDLLPAEGARVSGEENTIADFSYPCPNYCSDSGL